MTMTWLVGVGVVSVVLGSVASFAWLHSRGVYFNPFLGTSIVFSIGISGGLVLAWAINREFK